MRIPRRWGQKLFSIESTVSYNFDFSHGTSADGRVFFEAFGNNPSLQKTGKDITTTP
jgi:hypothetical protein